MIRCLLISFASLLTVLGCEYVEPVLGDPDPSRDIEDAGRRAEVLEQRGITVAVQSMLCGDAPAIIAEGEARLEAEFPAVAAAAAEYHRDPLDTALEIAADTEPVEGHAILDLYTDVLDKLERNCLE